MLWELHAYTINVIFECEFTATNKRTKMWNDKKGNVHKKTLERKENVNHKERKMFFHLFENWLFFFFFLVYLSSFCLPSNLKRNQEIGGGNMKRQFIYIYSHWPCCRRAFQISFSLLKSWSILLFRCCDLLRCNGNFIWILYCILYNFLSSLYNRAHFVL